MIEILLVVVLMIANGIFSMSEMAIVSARRARLQQLARQGDRRAALALALAESPDRLLSTVQIGITLIGILAGAVGGATIAEQIGIFLRRFPLLADSAEMIGVGIVVIGITFLSLIIGELVPKRIALGAPEAIARVIAAPMNGLARLASPLVRVLEVSTSVVFSLLRIKHDPTPSISEEEIKILIEEGTQSGVFNEAEESLVSNIFRLADQRISTLMIPRLRMTWLDVNDPPTLNRQRVIDSTYAVFPVARGSVDEIFGLVRGKDLLASLIQLPPGEEVTIPWESLLIRPPRIPETLSALDALDHFRAGSIPMALVIDQHGAVEGLITPEDILRGIVGDQLLQESTAVSPADSDAVAQTDGSWVLAGSISLHRLRELLPLGVAPGEERGHFTTLAGLIMALLGRIPRRGDQIEWKGFRFEVLSMEGRRVEKVHLRSRAAPGR